MANHRIEQRTDVRTELARGLEGARSPRGQSTQQDSGLAGFSSVLASLDGLAQLPATALQAMDGLGQAAAAAAATVLERDASADPALALSAQADALLQADPMLLAASGQTPWLSLVAQTAQLDGKNDRDLVQGATGDWLSGRGNTMLAALRQQEQSVAHAAFMAPQPAAGASLATAVTEAAAQAGAGAADAAGLPFDGSGRASAQTALADTLAGAAVAAMADTTAASGAARHGTAGAAAHIPQAVDQAGMAPRQDMALASGIALQGMTAVKPEEWRGLFERAREGGTPADTAASALHGVAAAVGAAHAGQQAGQQTAGQNAQAFAQAQPEPQSQGSEREQQVSEQVAYWVHSKTQNASLSVEHEGRAIQVQVSLQGNEAHVRFGSSEAQAREWLGNGAEQLRELLQAQGLQLAGVSVDAGGQGDGEAGRQAGGEPSRQARVSALVDGRGVTEGVDGLSAAAQAARAAGGVDLFV